MKFRWSHTGFAPMQIYAASICLLYKKQNAVLIVYHIRWSSTLFRSLCVAVWLKACELTAETLGLGDISPRTGSNFSWHSIRLKWMEQPECTAHILRAIQRQAWDFWLQSIFFFCCTILLKLYSNTFWSIYKNTEGSVSTSSMFKCGVHSYINADYTINPTKSPWKVIVDDVWVNLCK